MEQKFRRSLEELGGIVRFTERFFAEEKIAPSLRYIVDLCVEELFVNTVTYNTETRADIVIEMRPHEDGIHVSITDQDVARFDPRAAAAPDLDAPLEKRAPGGLGLYLVLKMADSVHYEYRDRTSIISFIAKPETRRCSG